HNRCTGLGVGATAGIFHSAGYLHGRVLLQWLGCDADGTYVVLLAINALGVALVALAARRLEGRAAAALAALLMIASLGVATWIVDAGIFLSQLSTGTVGNGRAVEPHSVLALPMARLTAVATLAWAAAAALRPSLRRRLDVPAAVFLPLFAPLALGSWVGLL